MRGLVLRMGEQELAHVPLGDIPHRFNFMLSLPQSDIEGLLIEALAERGIAIGWHTRLSSLETGRGTCQIALKAAMMRPTITLGSAEP